MQQLANPARVRCLAQTGTTLHEVLVATALGLVVIAAFSAFSRAQLSALRNQTTQLRLQASARGIVELFAREVRRAGLDPTCADSITGIAEAKENELHVHVDLNDSGAIDGINEDVTYRYDLSRGAVERLTGGRADTLITGMDLRGSRIRYFDGGGVELTPRPALAEGERAAVRRVRFELALANGPAGSPARAEVAADVDLRNRFFLDGLPCP